MIIKKKKIITYGSCTNSSTKRVSLTTQSDVSWQTFSKESTHDKHHCKTKLKTEVEIEMLSAEKLYL